MSADTTATTTGVSRREAVVEQLFLGAMGALETLHVYVGDRLGLYAALAEMPDATPAKLAEGAGVAERYAREWLEQQAVAGLVDLVSDDGDPITRRYRLPAEVAEVMTDADSLNYLAPLASMVASLGQTVSAVAGGVPDRRRGAVCSLWRRTFAAASRGSTGRCSCTSWRRQWIPAMPDVQARLQRPDPPARVADLGCGSGWSSIALARAYPAVHVDGIDLDEASIAEARRNAEQAQVGDRVRFESRDAGDPALAGRYDLVMFFETLHDMADPVSALRAAGVLLVPGGAVLVGDEKVAETFTAPGDALERFNYGWSALHCLPSALTEPNSAAIGTVIRPETVRGFARQAGFSEVTVLPVEHDFWRFYRLNP